MKRLLLCLALLLPAASAFAQNIRPAYLKEGDQIALISPSYATPMENVDKAVEVLKNWGFEPVVGPNVGKEHVGRYAGTVQERLEDLRWALENPDIKAILCNRGGYGTLHLIDSLSLEEFRAHPKWLVGYSDITTLLALENCAGIQSLHATMGASIAKNGNVLTSTQLRDFLVGDLPQYELVAHPQNILGKGQGMLVGGNLCTLTPLLGTRADITANEGLILYIEEIEESMHNIDRQFKMLENAGVLGRCRGVLLGDFTDCGHEFTYESVEQMLRPYLEPYGIPVACGFPAGHGQVNMPLIMGATVTLDVRADGATLSFE